MKPTRIAFAVLLLTAALLPPAAGQAVSTEAYEYFALNCRSCHTIGGGPLAGPDLRAVGERMPREWLVRFILDPKAVIDSGDPYAVELLRQSRGVVMPPTPGLQRAMAEKLLDVIEHESTLERSRFAGLALPDRPLTEEDRRRGAALFLGTEAFASRAPACIGCHAHAGLGGLGGGRLGPDLTAVAARMETRDALAAWLSAPPSPVMAPVYRAAPLDDEEVLALTAYLRALAAGGAEEADDRRPAFLFVGVTLAALLLVAADAAWSGRYVATRRPLVEGRLGRRNVTGEHSP